MDRVVKIWPIRNYQNELLREDKPLFSSTLVHRSSAASVTWSEGHSDGFGHLSHDSFRLSEDTLLTHCTSTKFASHIELPDEPSQSASQGEAHIPKKWTGGTGRIVVLRWLGLNRFFPPPGSMATMATCQETQRGCVSVSCVAQVYYR